MLMILGPLGDRNKTKIKTIKWGADISNIRVYCKV